MIIRLAIKNDAGQIADIHRREIKKGLNWKPKVSLDEGLVKTYQWIEGQVRQDSNIA